MTDDELTLEFEVLAKRAGLAIPDDRRAPMFAAFKEVRGLAALLRQPREATHEPAATYDLATVLRGLG